ncbi:hypothetical protein [Siphonobacter curvatus]|uniref:Uncharacterized protein n=1 Tax=Siphonobacter curvatus TaxID=2094562 RepID=A0A2S7IRD8_9BACT|nr:hypothetical protein [Siphonobacter curvatus]PQA60150.1 hypothetical protein C5O19_11185 [Siphonobacter curvatus]
MKQFFTLAAVFVLAALFFWDYQAKTALQEEVITLRDESEKYQRLAFVYADSLNGMKIELRYCKGTGYEE